MTLKTFSTAAKSVEDNDAPIGVPIEVTMEAEPRVKLEEKTVTFIPPTTGQWAVTLAGQGDTTEGSEKIASQINFFFSMLDEKDEVYFKQRLFNREDPFDIDNVAEIIDYLMEEWSARPTKLSSVSSDSPPSAGKRSTAVRHRTTR